MKTSKTFAIVVSLLMVAGSIGCVALSEYVTPAAIDQQAVQYVTGAGVAEPNDFAGYGNLYKAGLLTRAVNDAHAQYQLTMQQSIDKDALNYAQLNDAVRANLTVARQQEELLFSEKGIIAMGMGLAGFGTLTGLIGLSRKRLGDLSPLQVKQALAGTEATLTAREEQFAELVKGIQKFRETLPRGTGNDGLDKELVSHLNGAQSASTKELVAIVKANL